jgi:general secretion pathway protein A
MSETDIPIKKPDEIAAPTPLEESHGEAQSVEESFLRHYGLNEQPFGDTPDLRFLYFGPQHRQALAALNYGTESNRGFLTLIARPGMGKTSLIFQFLEGLRERARTVFLFHTECDSRDLLRYLLTDLGLDIAGKDIPEMHAILNQVLLEEMRAGRRVIVVIDEAQNLSEKVLESVRLLSNFEAPWTKPMQIVLAGQPQLNERLNQPSMLQLKQRVSLSIRIAPLVGEEISAYVSHRLWVAGYEGAPLFSVGAQRLLAEVSEGIPRTINNICFCAMSLGWATAQRTIDREMMRDALEDMNLASPNGPPEITENSAENANLSASQVIHLPVLTKAKPRNRSWLAKAGLGYLLVLALGWSGFQINLGQRLANSIQEFVTPEKTQIAPTAAPVSLDSTAADVFADPAHGRISEASAGRDRPGTTQRLRSGQSSQTGSPAETNHKSYENLLQK